MEEMETWPAGEPAAEAPGVDEAPVKAAGEEPPGGADPAESEAAPAAELEGAADPAVAGEAVPAAVDAAAEVDAVAESAAGEGVAPASDEPAEVEAAAETAAEESAAGDGAAPVSDDPAAEVEAPAERAAEESAAGGEVAPASDDQAAEAEAAAEPAAPEAAAGGEVAPAADGPAAEPVVGDQSAPASDDAAAEQAAGESPAGDEAALISDGPETGMDAGAEPVSAEELLAGDLFAAGDAAPAEDIRLKAVLEAIVYITEEPLSLAQISAALNQPQERIRPLLRQLIEEFEAPGHGLTVKEVAGGYKMATKPEHHEAVRNFVKNLKPPLKLSLAALETLAVIAYKQPVTAPEIMEIRGVQGAGVLKTLLDRRLIAAAGRKNVIGKPILYKTTKDFLVQFGLKDLSELPTLKEFEEIGRMALGDGEAEAEPPAESPAEPVAEPPAAAES